jgi:hypothetical protein
MEQPNFDRFSIERYGHLPPARQKRSISLIEGHLHSVLEIACNAEIGGARRSAAVFDNYAQMVVEDLDQLAEHGIAGVQQIFESLERVRSSDGSLPETILTKKEPISKRRMMRDTSP